MYRLNIYLEAGGDMNMLSLHEFPDLSLALESKTWLADNYPCIPRDAITVVPA